MPQLGATDYTPFTQGSIRGSESVARGIEILGQAAAQGVQQYYQKKEEKQLLADTRGRVKQILSSNPAFAQGLGISDLNDDKAVDAAIKGIGGGDIRRGAAVTNQMLMQLSQQEQQAAARAQRLSGLASSLERSGVPPAVVAAIRSDIPVEDAVKLAPARPDKALDPVSFRGQDAQGNPVEITIDRLTGQQISVGPVREQPRMIRTPQEEADAAALATEAKAEAEGSVKFLDTIAEQASTAQQNAPRFARLRQLLESPATNTGVLEEYRTVLRGIAVQLGAKDATLADQQAMEALLAEDALLETRRLLSGQGAVTEAERARIDKLALSAGRSRPALLELLGFRDAALARSIEAENRRIGLIEQGVKPRDAAKVMRRWMRDNPVSAFVPAEGFGNDEEVVRDAFSIATGQRQ